MGELTWVALTSDEAVRKPNNAGVTFADMLDGTKHLEYDPDTISDGAAEVQLILRRLGYTVAKTKKYDAATLQAYRSYAESRNPQAVMLLTTSNTGLVPTTAYEKNIIFRLLTRTVFSDNRFTNI